MKIGQLMEKGRFPLELVQYKHPQLQNIVLGRVRWRGNDYWVDKL